MKQFKTDEEQFRKFITKAEKITSIFKDIIHDIDAQYPDCVFILKQIENYKKELGMLKHPDAVKSDRYIEQEIPFTHE